VIAHAKKENKKKERKKERKKKKEKKKKEGKILTSPASLRSTATEGRAIILFLSIDVIDWIIIDESCCHRHSLAVARPKRGTTVIERMMPERKD